MESNHTCVFCSRQHPQRSTNICCLEDHEHDEHVFTPAGESVMLAQIVDSEPVVTIHEDLSNQEIAAIMAAFMDKVSNFDHVRKDPTAIMQAMMGMAK